MAFQDNVIVLPTLDCRLMITLELGITDLLSYDRSLLPYSSTDIGTLG